MKCQEKMKKHKKRIKRRESNLLPLKLRPMKMDTMISLKILILLL
jgi:hypothetical protein